MSGDKNTAKPIKTVIIMMAATAVAKGLGLVRQMIQGWHYGIGMEANAFSLTYNIPQTFFEMLFSAAILGCFIPVYNSFTTDSDGKRDADRFACLFINVIILFTGLLALLGIIFARPIINVLGSELNVETQALAIKLLRIMFPMIIFIGATYTLVGVSQSKGRYILPAFISAISNAGVIIYLVAFNSMLGDNGIYGLSIVYALSWVIQFITLIIPLIRNGFKYILTIDFKNPQLLRTIKMAPPIMVGSWLIPFILMSGLHFAPYVGNVTVFDYSFIVFTLISGILTHSLCNYIFPILSRLSVHGNEVEYNNIVRTGLTVSLAIMIPFMFMVYILSGEGISVMYLRGEFTPDAAYLTASTLRLLTGAMPAFAVIEILNRVFYSKNLYKVPMTATICGIVINVIASVTLIRLDGVGVGAISTAAALAQITTAIVLLIFLKRKIKGIFNIKFLINALKITFAGIISFAVMMLLYRFIGNNPYDSGVVWNIMVMCIVFAAGAAVYMGGLFVTRVKIKG